MAMSVDIRIIAGTFDPDGESARFRQRFAAAGAVVAFLGAVRGEGEAGAVSALRLDHYPGFTEKEIAAIAGKAQERWPLLGLAIVHRVGEMRPGEPIVFVAAAAAHRRAAFEAVDFLMDYLKSEAPFWKQEIAASGARWIEPTQKDHEDKARWRA